MKRFFYLVIFVVVLFANCKREVDTVDTTEHLYLCNELERTITLRLFRGDDVAEYKIEPNDTFYFTTIHSAYVVGEGESVHFPPDTERTEFLCSFDSVAIRYELLRYSFTKNETIWNDSTNATLYLIAAYPINRNSIGDCSYYTYDEEYFEFLDRELKNKNYDAEAHSKIDFVYKVYLINQLDNVVDLEVFKKGELAAFKLAPKDTVYFTTIEWNEYKGDKTNVYQGWNEYEASISSIDSVNLFYNGKKYTYTDDRKIRQLFELYWDVQVNDSWFSYIDEKKKQGLGWE